MGWKQFGDVKNKFTESNCSLFHNFTLSLHPFPYTQLHFTLTLTLSQTPPIEHEPMQLELDSE